jgi:hypothetical protein
MIAHVIDVGANYWSLWNFHQINVEESCQLLPGIANLVRPDQSSNRLLREAVHDLEL